ncbi:unnamed protein product [Spirodela intermedia]|uniref:Uncharacterized protein n=1 Tax=Spirodela intermedia TaxID=51605 RepID=A0A7I8J6B1_SPIIN|nr:unnamed protein product [Spirodela intermedia]CAA6664982.1 unnamed protein product [Spirodela intermedia]
MGSSTRKACNVSVSLLWVSLLGCPLGFSPRCNASSSASPGGYAISTGSNGTTAACTTTGGTVVNSSTHGGAFAACYASATSSSPPAEPSAAPSRPGQYGHPFFTALSVWVCLVVLNSSALVGSSPPSVAHPRKA